jgi:hypothetical protein
MSWDQRFFDPIMVPGRKPLVTLRDAAQYMVPRIAMMKALQRHEPAARLRAGNATKAYEPRRNKSP